MLGPLHDHSCAASGRARTVAGCGGCTKSANPRLSLKRAVIWGMLAKTVREIRRIWRNTTWRISRNRFSALQQRDLLMTQRWWQRSSQCKLPATVDEAQQRQLEDRICGSMLTH